MMATRLLKSPKKEPVAFDSDRRSHSLKSNLRCVVIESLNTLKRCHPLPNAGWLCSEVVGPW